MNEPQPYTRPDAPKDADTQDADQKYRIGIVAKGQEPRGLVLGQQPLPVQIRRRLGTDGIAPNKSQQKRAAGRPWLVEQRRHHSCEVWGDPLSKPQGHQQAGYRQKGEQSWNDGLGTQGQGLRRSGPDLSRVRQLPHQNAAEHQTGKRQIARFHTHHQKRLCAKAGKFASFFA